MTSTVLKPVLPCVGTAMLVSPLGSVRRQTSRLLLRAELARYGGLRPALLP